VKSAIVTGGSSGIGLAVARVLAEEGYALTLGARSEERLAAAARELGRSVQTVAGNLVDEEAVRALVAAHVACYGSLDVLVNNAGVGIGSAVGKIQTKQLDLQLALDLRSVVLSYRESVGPLRAAVAENGRALVVNVASVAGLRGQPWLSVYSAAKAGVIAFTNAMNAELAGGGIVSCAVCPGTVDTELTGYLGGDRDWMIPASDVAESVRFLLRLSTRSTVPHVVLENTLSPGA
jgi:NAD(P)-dependent dehydrogenase (short-subunit alcohol dehydrogenase family)